MKELSPQVKRKQLEKKILQIFQEELRELCEDLQKVLADDMVTAFINRMAVFTEIESKTGVFSPGKTYPESINHLYASK